MYLCALYKPWKYTVYSKLQEIYLLEELVKVLKNTYVFTLLSL